MIPTIPEKDGTGTSFRGALLFYAHDERECLDHPHQTTNTRVAWVAVRNLAVDDVVVAEKIMSATARLANESKRRAGIPLTGRQSNRVVFHYSLSWHPTECPSREEMERAADESLEVLGAGNRQVVILCHTDRPHPHIHLVVNRVHDVTGVMLNLYQSMIKLSRWAREWELRHMNNFTPARKAREL